MRILFVATVFRHLCAFHIPFILMLKEKGYEIWAIASGDLDDKKELERFGVKCFEIPFSRNPISINNLKAYFKLKKFLRKNEFKLIHTHTPVASFFIRLIGRKLKNTVKLYTAHGFHFYKGAPFINWMIYYPIEKWLARYTDVLITINKEDFKRAKKFKAGKVKYIPGVGVDIDKINKVKVNKIKKRKGLGIPDNSLVVLSVGELNKNKNHETIIKAIAKLKNPLIYYVICGEGKLKNYLIELSKKLKIEKQVKLLGFRKDIIEICKVSDIFVFPSYREGLSLALMEAMSSGLPIVCSNIRGNIDLIVEGKGGYLVEPNDIDGFSEAIKKLINNRSLRNQMGDFNYNYVQSFDKKIIQNLLSDIYRASM